MLKVVPFSIFLFSAKILLLCFLRKFRKLFLPPIHVLAFFEKEGCFKRYHHFVQNVTRERQRKRTAAEGINVRGGADEYLWRERYGKNGPTAFENILPHIAEIYSEDRENQPNL